LAIPIKKPNPRAKLSGRRMYNSDSRRITRDNFQPKKKIIARKNISLIAISIQRFFLGY
jgi:hypothetical protein